MAGRGSRESPFYEGCQAHRQPVVKVALVSSGNSQLTGGGGGVVTEFFQAHRPTVLFVLSPTNLVYFSFSGPQKTTDLVLFVLGPTNLVYLSFSGPQT